MRVPITAQLSILVLLVALCSVAVPSIISWVGNYRYVTDQRLSRLSLIADFKCQQLVQAVTILHNSVTSIASRVLVQRALDQYNQNGHMPNATWAAPLDDLAIAMGTQNYLVQASLYDRNLTTALLNTTTTLGARISGISTQDNSLGVVNGDTAQGYNWNGHAGFPDPLYPTTYLSTEANQANTITPEAILSNNGIMLGPVRLNNSYYLLSFTVPIMDSVGLSGGLLGFLTVVAEAKLLTDLANSTQGYDSSTEELIVVGPNLAMNIWPTQPPRLEDDELVRYVLPPTRQQSLFNTTISLGNFPAAKLAFTIGLPDPSKNALNTKDPAGQRISVGYGTPDMTLTTWGVIISESHSELLSPVIRLRNALLITIFGTCGVVILLVIPLSYMFVRPITRLTTATESSKRSRSFTPDGGSREILADHGKSPDGASPYPHDNEKSNASNSHDDEERGRPLTKKEIAPDNHSRQSTPHVFRIPTKVKERRHLICDELTDLTHTFNEMTDEITHQYERLEERVQERTKQLREQREIAETANEAKSRFIANITHELRTPLNGILGMCAVCLADDDIHQIKHSLGIVNKSGELLLHLLNDLLTFSKTQYGGHQVTLDNRQFQMHDITSQILAVFSKQAKDKQINLGIKVVPERKVMEKTLWGDSNRILQVVINLISNGLKFTPSQGSVNLRISLGPEVGVFKNELEHRTSSTSMHASREQLSRDSSLTRRPVSILKNANGSGFVIHAANGSVLQMPSPDAPYGDENTNIVDSKTYMFEFQVRDSGPGIPIEQQQMVFEPFVQGDLGLNKKYGGTGLGLSICKQLAKLMNGSITLESHVDDGCLFTLRIPLQVIPGDPNPYESLDGNKEVLEHQDASTNTSRVEGHRDVTTTKDREENIDPLAQISQPRLVGYSQPFFMPSEPLPPPPRSPVPLSSSPSLSSSPLPSTKPHKEGKSGAGMVQVEKSITEQYRKKIANLKKDFGRNPEEIRVLVAEDNLINQEVVMRMLKLEMVGSITLAKDGNEAVERVKEAIEKGERFDLVFMDVQMPNLDGIESTRIIRKLGYSAPIVALSALSEENNIQDCLDSGMDSFLSKPIRRPALKQVLKTYCAPITEEEVTPVEEKNEKRVTLNV